MKPTITVDARGFQNFIADLSKRAKKLPEEVLPSQVGRVLSTAVKFTKKATAKKAAERAENRTTRDFNTFGQGQPRSKGGGDSTPYVSVTKNGMWWVDRGKKGKRTFYKMDDPRRRWSDPRWGKYTEQDARRTADFKVELPKAIEAAKQSRGLSARAWVEIGELLDIPVEAPNYVRNARPANGKTYKNAFGKKATLGSTSYYEIGTKQPILVGRIDGAGILTRAVRNSIKAFENDIKYGIFASAQKAAARYPGIFVA